MIMRTFMLRQTEPLHRYLSVLMITVGVSSFVLFQNAKKGHTGGNSDVIGLALLMGSLFLDGLTGPVQESLSKSPHHAPPTSSELMLWQNVWATLIVLPVALFSGEFVAGIEFLLRFPEAINSVVLFVLTSAIGQNFVFYLLLRFDSLKLSIVTTTRKFFTILFSVVRFGHVLSFEEWLSVAVVFVGLFVDIIFSKFSGGKKHPTKPGDKSRLKTH